MLHFLPPLLLNLIPGLLEHNLINLLIVLNILLLFHFLLLNLIGECVPDHVTLLQIFFFLLLLFSLEKFEIVLVNLSPLVGFDVGGD